jgi:D-alanyl-lipoteichoic acid acyltransferase DltB (MBOAT superfamily)
MAFTSLLFGLFLAAVFLIYWTLPRRNGHFQNALLLAANVVFYARWDWRLCGLLAGAALVDYIAGLNLGPEAPRLRRRLFFALSLTVNVGLLGFLKYYNFFAESFSDFLRLFGLHGDPHTLRLLLPLGISFFTFQRLTYTIELFRQRIPVTRDLLAFLVFATFFPVVTAGPIERAKTLLPQFLKAREFNAASAGDGLRQVLWGLFRKIVIADNLAPIVAEAFAGSARLAGIDLAAALFLFSMQLYVDFAAYSDMAMGVGKLLGVRVMRNFAYPYFSRDIGEFWRRWHISMSSWFRDYVYTPLSMKVSLAQRGRRFLNILVTFAVSGLWHGANWTFVAWGTLHGLFFARQTFVRPPQYDSHMVAEGRLLPKWRELGQMLITFALVTLAWAFFRADSLPHALGYLGAMVCGAWLQLPLHLLPIGYCLALLGLEWLRRRKVHALQIEMLPRVARWAIYFGLVFAIFVFGDFGVNDFFYAQF